MAMNQDEADGILSKHYDRIAAAVVNAYRRYRKYPGRTIHRRATRATIVNDEIVAGVIQEFDGVSETQPRNLSKFNLRFLQIGDRVLLWFKKTDLLRRPRTYPTAHANRLEAGANTQLFPALEVLIVGYKLNRDETKVSRISISKPAGRKNKPLWYIDLEIPEDGRMAAFPQTPGHPEDGRPRVVVKKGAVQNKLEGA